MTIDAILLRQFLNSLPKEVQIEIANRRQDMLPFGRTLPVNFPESAKKAAVMALLYPRIPTHILLIQRSTYEGAHSAQISLPGGKPTFTETDLRETALRELNEEIGIHPEHISVLGSLSPVYIPVSKFLVYPYVGLFEGDRPEFKAQEREVSAIFEVPLIELLKPECKGLASVGLSNPVPCYFPGTPPVWGATALIIRELEEYLRLSVQNS